MPGVDFSSIIDKEKFFQAFVLLHEIGHIVNCERDFRNTDDWESRLDTQIGKEMATLPIPGVFYRTIEGWDESTFKKEFAINQARLESLGITNRSQLEESSQIAYKNLPTEIYADTFALEYITKLFPELFINNNTVS